MDLVGIASALLSIGLTCHDARIEVVPKLPWPAAYVRSVEGENIVYIRSDQPEDRYTRLVLHEELHCGLFERKVAAGVHITPLDPREEMQVQALTDELMRGLQ